MNASNLLDYIFVSRIMHCSPPNSKNLTPFVIQGDTFDLCATHIYSDHVH